MPFKRIQRPVILGIVGDSASGKSTIADGISAILGPEKVVSICTDDYHRMDRLERAKRGITALNPEANHIDILEQHVGLLREGQPILKPYYDHASGTFGPCQHVEPREYVILDFCVIGIIFPAIHGDDTAGNFDVIDPKLLHVICERKNMFVIFVSDDKAYPENTFSVKCGKVFNVIANGGKVVLFDSTKFFDGFVIPGIGGDSDPGSIFCENLCHFPL